MKRVVGLSSLFVILVVLLVWSLVPDGAEPSETIPAAKRSPGQTPAEMHQAAQARKAVRKQTTLKADGPDEIARYHQQIRTRLDDPTLRYGANYRHRALRAARARGAQKAARWATRQLDWRERGPANVSGRTRGLVIDVRDPSGDTWYAGSVGGGVWKTTDAGRTWQNLTPDLPNLATVALVQCVSQPEVFYVGTGEGFFNTDAVAGSGVWKSTDGGQTWRQLEATVGEDAFRAVNRLAVDPQNPDVVVAGTNSGIFRTADGGQTWQFVHDGGGSRVQQIVADPSTFDVLYATAHRTGVYQSTDAGQTWTQVFDWEQRYGPSTNGGRLELAVAPSNPGRVYVGVDAFPNADLFLSADRGSTWVAVEERSGRGPNWLGGQGWYDHTIAVHPFDEDVVYVGGIDVWQIDVSGPPAAPARSTFRLTDAYGAAAGAEPYIHPDHHNLRILTGVDGPGTFRLLNANDGGVAHSDDGGQTWTETVDWAGGYNTTQFYGADKRPGADEYIGGMQDNGTWRSPAGVDAEATTRWLRQVGGDGFMTAWHAEDPRKIMGSYQFNGLVRTTNGGQTWRSAVIGLGDVGRDGGGKFISTIAKSQSDPDLLFTTGDSGVWRSDDFGVSWHPATLDDPDAWFTSTGRIPAEISVADPQVVWAGAAMSSQYRLFVSKDGGLSFRAVARPEGLAAPITGLATHPADSATAYALFSIPASGNPTIKSPKVLRTTDLGGAWEDLTGTFTPGATLSSTGFPDVAIYDLLVMPFDPDVLWVGTEIGLFVSEDGGQTWQRAETGLPAAAIWQLSIVDDQVVVATHGRGVWSVTLPELANYAPPVVTRAPRLNATSVSPAGGITLDVSLRSPYDSVAVAIDSTRISTVAGATAVTDTTLSVTLAVEAPREVRIGVVGYRGGRAFRSFAAPATLFPAGAVQNSFATDFDDGGDPFVGDGFRILQPLGFASPAIHSPHPHPDNRTFTFQLTVPIRVAEAKADAVLRYRDVAIIEPGEPGSRFGDFQFWDYVVVEGSTDGATWKPLAPGYDARRDASWLALYQAGGEERPSEDDFVTQEINLHDTFAPGDVIFVRFRLEADASVTGWGWVVDDLEIQPDAPVADETAPEVPDVPTLHQNYPNPFNPTTTIPFTLRQRADVTVMIYDLQGRRVATVADGPYLAGTHEVAFDASGLASGVYLYRLEVGGQRIHKTMTLVK
jgi:photosystem II stability/assembly factor-like uncharacterized protein